MKNRFSLVLSALTLSAAVGAAQADVLTVNADGSVQQVESAQAESPQAQQSSRQASDTGFQTFSRRGTVRGIGAPRDAGTTARDSERRIQPYPHPYDNVTSKHKNDKIVVQPGTDVIVNGDNTKIVIKPGQNYYGGYYPPYYAGYPYGYNYGYGNGYSYGYPANYGYGYGYGYSYPGYNYGYNWPTYTYGPGTTTTTYNGSALGYGFGGYAGGYNRPSSGINVTIGGGRQSVQSTTTVTVAPGSSMSVSGPGYSPYGAPPHMR